MNNTSNTWLQWFLDIYTVFRSSVLSLDGLMIIANDIFRRFCIDFDGHIEPSVAHFHKYKLLSRESGKQQNEENYGNSFHS
ncbi:MAG: hypothetical protein O2856_08010 [Planctomycetota bacterium]|nr:hypothetical protein [Planctomycetota bacterium]